MSEYEATKAAIRGLTRAQRNVLDHLCCGNDSAHHPKPLAKLVSLGLAEERKEWVNAIMYIRRYDVPLHVHMAWAEVCAGEGE